MTPTMPDSSTQRRYEIAETILRDNIAEGRLRRLTDPDQVVLSQTVDPVRS